MKTQNPFVHNEDERVNFRGTTSIRQLSTDWRTHLPDYHPDLAITGLPVPLYSQTHMGRFLRYAYLATFNTLLPRRASNLWPLHLYQRYKRLLFQALEQILS